MTTLNKTGRPAYMYEESTQTWYQVSGLVSTGANYQWVGTHQFDNNTTFVGTVNVVRRFNSFLNATARAAAITDPQIGLITFIQQDNVGATVNLFEYWNGTSWTSIVDPTTTVTINGTQTLTNKTLTSPTINTPTINTPTVNGGTIVGANNRIGISTPTITANAYTLATNLSDAGKFLELSNSVAMTLTVPNESTANYPVGTQITLVQTGAGQVTVSGAGGVTVNGTPGLKTRAQWSLAVLTKRSTANTWLLTGDLVA